jgi:hypothetical protein
MSSEMFFLYLFSVNVQLLSNLSTTMASRPKIVIENTVFLKNYKAIDVKGFNRANLNSRLAGGSTFKNILIDGSIGNLKPKNGVTLPRRAFNGIAGTALNTISFGHSTINNSFTSIQINNVRKPFEFYNSASIYLLGIGVDNRQFLDNAGGWLSEEAIYDFANLNLTVTNFENSLSQKVLGCKKALNSFYTTSSSLKNVHIEDVDVAANYWLTQFINSHNNKMWVNSAGILANSPKNYSVTKNNILHKNTPSLGVVFAHNPVKYGGIGVGINYPIEQSNTLGTVEDNEIFVKANPDFPDAVCAGILLNKAVNATIRGNDIKLQNDMPVFSAFSRFYGVNKSGGYDNTICGNDIKGLLNYDRGIGSSMSPGNITCNLIQFTRAGLYFTGDNKKPNAISGNEIADAYAGVYVNSLSNFQAHLGEQSFQGNKWVNNWVYGGLWTGDDQVNLPFSKFINNEVYPFSPNVDSEPLNWFEKLPIQNAFTNCIYDAGVNSNDCNDSGTGGGEKLNSLASEKDNLKEPYRSMVLRKAYAQIIATYHGISMPPEYKNFINDNAEFGFAKLAEIDYLISHPLADFPVLEKSISTLSDSIQKLVPEYLTYQKTLDDLPFAVHVNLGQTQTNATVNALTSLTSQLESKKYLSDSIQLEHWELASTLNNSLAIDNDYTNLERQVNSIYLNLLIENQSLLNSSDSLFVRFVAYYCPQDWG